MRRFVGLVFVLALGLALAIPASGDTVVNECSATSAATVKPIIGDTAPVCTFEVTCTGVAFGCVYLVTLDSNGTGLVEGTLSAEVAGDPGGTAAASFIDAGTGDPAPDPTCSGAFQCHYASSNDNPVVLLVTGASGAGTSVLITCAGGGISVLETVGCNVVNVEFEGSPA